MPMWRGLARWAALVAIALTQQGCDYDVPTHHIGNWRKEPDFLIDFEFIPPGGSSKDAKLNSCSLDRLAQSLQCSGRGVCQLWDEEALANQISFCRCDRDWADPECRTGRKSQTTAYVLSLFFGYLGADHFYLGLWMTGSLKLVTLGGAGVWWAVDIMRIGSAPVAADKYNTANDLTHYAFILCTVSFALFLGFVVALTDSRNSMIMRKRQALMMHGDSETTDGHAFSSAFESSQQPPLGGMPNYGAAQKVTL